MDNIALVKELSNLSPDQLKAVKSKSKYLRIVAGAGAGKTRTMSTRIVYLLGNNVKPKDIVAFTFTERAARNLKTKIYEVVKKVDPELCNQLGEMYIGTIHAFCFQFLQDKFGFGNYDVLDENQEMAFLLQNGWELGLGNGGNYSENCRNFLSSMEVIYNELLSEKNLESECSDFYRHFKKYEGMLDKHKLLTFSRIINLLVSRLENNKKPI